MAEMNVIDKHMAAAAFAEAGEADTARQMLKTEKPTSTAPQKGPAAATKPYAQILIFGALSAACYFALFSNETLVTEIFTMGGWHTLYPVLTAFLFSFIHSAFASNLLSSFGLEARKK